MVLASLVVRDGAAAGARLELRGEIVLGRDGDAVGAFEHDAKVSRRHAVIRASDDAVVTIEDLGSSNGTFVNGARIVGSRQLRNGDVIRIGRTSLALQLAPAADETQRADPEPAVLFAPTEQVGAPSSIHTVQRASDAHGPSPGWVIHADKQIAIPGGGMSMGRASDNQVVIDSERASRHHARIMPSDGRYYVADLGSTNGTHLNGERLLKEARWLNPGDSIVIAGQTTRFFVGDETQRGEPVDVVDRTSRVLFDGGRLTLGRDPSNDLCLDAPNVSRFHAEVVAASGGLELRDLRSRNGTRVNGALVNHASIVAGSEIAIGSFRLVFDGRSFIERDDRGALRLDAREVVVSVREKLILDRASLSVQPGEFVALIGESGAGKTTLLRVLGGVRRPTSGGVYVSGAPVATRLPEIGYLPQDEIVHPRLTVLESLRYSARLRLPLDSSEQELETAVERVLSDMSLEAQAGTRIGSLSGGQRKRVGLATELLSSPGLLFLDEPTTGLDPGLETRMMQLFRELAQVGRSALIVTTHATKNLDLVDTLCVIGRGGNLCFVGPPAEARAFFGASSYDEIYGALEDRSAEEWRRQFEASSPRVMGSSDTDGRPAESSASRSGGTHHVWPQTRTLLDRYRKVFIRDVRNLLILLLQVPLIALAMALLFDHDVFGAPGFGSPSDAALLLFLMVTAVTWLGTLDGAREIVKERVIFERETATGVDFRAYLASKVLLLFTLAGAQAATLLAVVLIFRPLTEPGGTKLLLLCALALTSWTAVSMGLAISATARSEDQAIALIPIAMVVQLLFAGSIATVANMSSALAAFSTLVFERWAFAGVGAVVELNTRIASDPLFSERNPYGDTFFAIPPLAAISVLALFLAAFLSLTLLALRRQTRV